MQELLEVFIELSYLLESRVGEDDKIDLTLYPPLQDFTLRVPFHQIYAMQV